MGKYITNLQWAQRSGIGIRVVDENVGTGAGTATAVQSFDLDKDNVISNSYTISSSRADFNNVVTALVENTDYTLDKESGRILTTATGAGTLGEDRMFATYWYTDAFSDDVVTDLIASAEADVEKLTGRNWGTSGTAVEYHHGRRTLGYPTTDRPYTHDWDEPDFIILNQPNVRQINNVYLLNKPQQIAKFYNYDDGTATFTDQTTGINSSTGSLVNLFDSSPATNDIVYIGSENPFTGLQVTLSTAGVGASTIDWEYYNGSAWTDISETETDSGSSTFTASGRFSWTYPYGWTKTTVNSQNYYWIRGTLTDNYSTDPIAANITLIDSVSTVVEPYQISYRENGLLSFVGVNVPDGTNNVRIDYNYGLATVPEYIKELSILLASEKAFLSITGSSYDEATGYTLGSKSIQIGEAWVNVKQVLTEIRNRVKSILDSIGKKGDVSVI